MITDFKTRLFCERTGLPRGEVDATDPIWLERITAYFDGANGMPSAGDPTEYAAAFEAVFPEARDRRTYIDTQVRKGTASFGHRVFASILTSGYIPAVFTTNFDSLIERTTVATDDLVPADDRAHLTVGALDAVDRAVRCVRDGTWPVLVKIHGDYQSEDLKNTTDELREQDEQLRGLVLEVGAQLGLVVVGYSGRDDSVMDLLDQLVAAEGSLPGGLWWVARPGSALLPRVQSLLEDAETAGVSGGIVECETFDELCGDLGDEIDLTPALRAFIDELRPRPFVEPVPLPTVTVEPFPALRCSALQLLELPHEATKVTLDTPLTSIEARKMVKDSGLYATVASRGRTLIAFGADADLETAFADVGGRVAGRVQIHPESDSIDLGLVYDAFLRAMTRRRPLRPRLRRRGHQIVVRPPDPERSDEGARRGRAELRTLQQAYSAALSGEVAAIHRPFAEAVDVALEHWNGVWWCVFEPFTWVELYGADTAGRDAAADWRRERWAQRYNTHWNKIIAAWAHLLAPVGGPAVAAHGVDGEGIDAVFDVSNVTAWSTPARLGTDADR